MTNKPAAGDGKTGNVRETVGFPSNAAGKRAGATLKLQLQQGAVDEIHVFIGQPDVGGLGVFDGLCRILRTGKDGSNAGPVGRPAERKLGQRHFFLAGQRFQLFQKGIGLLDAVRRKVGVDVPDVVFRVNVVSFTVPPLPNALNTHSPARLVT